MTKKQRATAITEFLSEKLKKSANDFHSKEYEDEEDKSQDLGRVIIIRDLLKELNDGQKN